jgi:hypothetical protein
MLRCLGTAQEFGRNSKVCFSHVTELRICDQNCSRFFCGYIE